MDFFFLGVVKTKIWDVPAAQQPKNVAQLEAIIRRECAIVPNAVTQQAFNGLVESCRICITVRCQAFDDE